mgnify:CR=1 FL=1
MAQIMQKKRYKMQLNMESCVLEEKLKNNVLDLSIISEAIKKDVRSVKDIMTPPKTDGWVDIIMPDGIGAIKTILSNRYCKVVNSWYFPNSVFDNHKHDGMECLFVYHGILELNLVDKKQTIILGGSEKPFYYIKPRQLHGGYFPEFTALVGVTMPPDMYWPE